MEGISNLENNFFFRLKTVIPPGVFIRERQKGKISVYVVSTEEVHEFDETGTVILKLIKDKMGDISVGELINEILKQFQIDLGSAIWDIMDFLDYCLKSKILAPIYDYYSQTGILYEFFRFSYDKDITYLIDEIISKKASEKNLRFLDVGCGSGRLFFASYPHLEQYNIDWFGVDNSLVMLLLGEIKRNLIKKRNINYFFAGMHEIDSLFSDDFFDIITFGYHSFDHLLTQEEQVRVLKKIYDLLKNNGLLIINSLNRNYQPIENKWVLEEQLELNNIFIKLYSFFKNLTEDLHQVLWCWEVKNTWGENISTICAGFKRANIDATSLSFVLTSAGFQIKKTIQAKKELYMIAEKN